MSPKITSIADAGSPLQRGLLSPQLLEVHVRDDENDEEPQRVEDEQDAPTRVADGEVRDAGRDQGDAESEVGELLYLGRDTRNQQRQDSQRLGDRQLDPEVIRQMQ